MSEKVIVSNAAMGILMNINTKPAKSTPALKELVKLAENKKPA